jgi:RNA polymerase sigma factor for flagellar operon FliA
MTPAEVQQWNTFRDPHCLDADKETIRQDLLQQYLPLVEQVVRRLGYAFPSATAEYADMVQSGVIGLMDAVERFDPAIKVEFRSYAQARIRGSVLDELRSLDWTPRSVREKARQLNRATDALNNDLSRRPTEQETARALGISLPSLQRLAQEAQIRFLHSLEGLIEIEGESASWPRREAEQEHATRHREMVDLLNAGLNRLTARERLLLKRYYENERTLREIAAELGVTESRVCQIHSTLIAKLRTWFDAQFELNPTPSMMYHQLARA